MNKATTPRRWAMAVMTFACLVAAQSARAQCTDFIAVPAGPVTINLTLSAGGTVNLNNAVLNSNGFTKNAACDYWLAEDAVLSANSTDSTNSAFYTNTPVPFNCADVGAPQKWYVRVGGTPGSGGIGTLGGPGATIVPITVNVFDNIPPVVVCPASPPPVPAAVGLCSAVVNMLDPTVTEACPLASQTWTKTGATTGSGSGSVSGTSFNVGTTTITYTAADVSGNTGTCSFTVTVTDAQAPSALTCPGPVFPAPIASGTDAGVCYADLDFTAPAATDNCPGLAVTWAAPGAVPASGSGNMTDVRFPEGATVTVTYTATDAAMNTSTCQFNVLVTDDDDPVFTSCPAAPFVRNAANAPACNYTAVGAEFNLSATDNCVAPSLTNDYNFANTLAGESFPLGTTNVVWEATDADGNVTSCTITITVNDVTPPNVAPVPANQTTNLTVTAGDCSKVVTFTRPSFGIVTDCSTPVLMHEEVISGPDPLVLSGAPAFNQMTGGGMVTVQFPAGTTVIHYYWEDAEGNQTPPVVYTFNIAENEAPNAVCNPSSVTLNLDPQLGAVVLDPSLIDNGSTDNCGIASISVSPSVFYCTDLGPQMVTLTITDNAAPVANTATCPGSVYIVDNTSPLITCPSNVVASALAPSCEAAINDLIFTQAAPVPPITVGPQEYFDNSVDCGVTFEYKLSGALSFPATFTPVSPSGMTLNDYDLSFLSFPTGLTTVTVRVLDGSNNVGTCSFTVNVTDQTGPDFTPVAGPPASPANGSTVNLMTTVNGCGQFYDWSWPMASDACNNPVTTVLQTHQPGAFFPIGSTTVSYLAKDNQGNIGTYTFKVVVTDAQPPVAKCQNVILSLDAMGTGSITTAQVNNASTDNCFFTLALSQTNFTCANLGTNVVTLTATDVGGLTSSCTATITVQDQIPPTVTCQAGTLVVNLTGTTATITPAQIYATIGDNCIAKDSIRLDAGAYAKTLTVGCPQIGAHVVTVKVTDNANNTATCTRNVQVNDTGNPVITAPAPVTVSCEVFYAQAPYNSGMATATDNCATPTITFSDINNPPTCPNGFTITRVWKATDAAGNMTTATQLITVQDIVKPVFTMAPSVAINSTTGLGGSPSCSGPLTLTVQDSDISDNCTSDANLTFTYTIDYPTPSFGYADVLTPQPGKTVGPNFPIGTTIVTFIAKDECNNTSSHTVTVVVTDVQGPVFNYPKCGQQVVLPNTSNACSNLYSWIRPWASVPNVNDCQFNPADPNAVQEIISNPTVQQSIQLSNPFDYDGFAFQVFATAQFPVGITTVTYLATDLVGRTSTCTFTVEVQDTQAPTLTCPGSQILAATCDSASIPDYRNLVLVSDNCSGSVQLTQTDTAGTLLIDILGASPAAGDTFHINIKGADLYNMSSCSFVVTLEDGDAPIPTEAVLEAIVDSCGGFVIDAPTAEDPCNPDAPIIYGTPSTPVGVFIPGTPPQYNLALGNYVITWVYDDGNGNISTQPQNITVLPDTFPPVALCKSAFSVQLDNNGMTTVTVSQMDNGSYDPNECGPITLSLINSILDCSELGTATVRLVVTDNHNNKDTCAVSVTVQDLIDPEFEPAPADTLILACADIPDAEVLGASDNCDDDVEITFTETSTQDSTGYGFYNYTITRVWVATDTSGNSTSVTQLITVADTLAPVFDLVTPDTIELNTAPDDLTCSAELIFDMADFVTDCAEGDDLTITSSGGFGTGSDISAFYEVGTHTVYFTAVDSSGNQAAHTLTIIVHDVTPPTAVCINGISASLQPSGTVSVATFQFNNLSFDNCTPAFDLDLAIQRLDESPLQAPGLLLTYDCDDADGVTQHPVKLFVTDEYGNMSMCETFIVIQDNVAPTITFCPPSKTVLCSDDLSPSLQQAAQATDNCPDNVTVDFDDFEAEADSTSPACYLINRVWTATDLAGNTATCVQTFSVLDTVAPVLSAYNDDIVISCDQTLPSPLTITATDNCSLNVPVLLEEDTINIAQGPCGNYSYTIARTRTAIDECGNIEAHTRLITVVDTTGPSFPGLPDTITVFSASNPPNANCTVPVSLDVSDDVFDCSALSEMLVLNDAPHGNDSLDASGNYAVGEYLIHFTATDACGNVGVDSVLLIVVDNSIPTAICNNNVVISLGSNGTASIMPEDIDLGSVDNCTIDTMFLDNGTFDCGDLGTNPVTLTVVDVNGNQNTCTVNVNVTLGIGSGLTVDAQGIDESFFGAADGEATVTATGGSGNFAYEWSTNDTTTTITGLSAGTYYVTVYDENSGCQQIDSVIIEEGFKIKITLGDVDGAQNEIVSVPVTVDNLNAAAAFSFTINVANPTVGTVLGVSGEDAALAAGLQVNVLAGNNLGILWTDIPPVTLPNGTILFYVDVQLTNAPVGSLSAVNLLGTPVVSNFTIDAGSGPLDVPFDLMNGTVEITEEVNTDVMIAGDIKTWANPENPNSVEKPVANVTVSLTGTVSDSEITTAAGTYDFDVPLNANTTTACSKTTVGPVFNAGVTAGDLLRIVNHIFGDTLPSPYQWVAADVNNSKTVTLADYLLIQRLALGTDQHILNSPDWKFVPKSYVFPANDTPNFGPLTNPYPQTITHNPADMDFLDDDFVAIRMGDVNGNTPVSLVDDPEERSGSTFLLRLEDHSFNAGDWVTVPFKASDFTGRQAYQLTINFDPTVFELGDIQPGALNLTDENFGTAHLADGYLTTLWVSRDPLTLRDDEVLFTLSFRALRNGSALSNVLRAGSEITRAEAYTPDGPTMPVEFEFVQPSGQTQGAFALYQNQPNPFRQGTSIGFRLPEAGRASLRVFNAAGQLVKLVVGQFEEGYNEVRFQQADFGAPGVYWYELETPSHSDRKKMILID